ncbi:MAG: hypothetical protein L6435_15230 [Anaerolineae bacterium]|nr:hypothetical protein [Anaerolineae bacterium]
MPVSNRELQALEIIQRYRGQTGYSTVAQAMHLSTEYAKTICQSLGQADYIDMASSGLCKITAKGIEELLNRGSITLEDPSGLSPSGRSLASADDEAGVPQEAGGSQAPWGWPDAPRQEPPRPAATPPGNMVDVKCAYCYGRGVDPFGCPSPSSKCAVCGGKGYNRVVAPYATCTACNGTGKLLGRRMTCTTCKGKGVMSVRPGAGTGHRFGTSVGAAASTAPGAIQRGQVAPLSLPRSQQPASVADQIATHITSFPGVKAAHVETLFGLSKGDAKKTLQELVQARKIRLEDDGLYYPA